MTLVYDKDGIQLYHGNCLEILPAIPQKVNLVLTDPPYGVTVAPWDQVPDLERMWGELERISLTNTAYVFTGSQPFTSKLVLSKLEWFKYELIWEKNQGTNPFVANISPLKAHENILVFCQNGGRTVYNPQMTEGEPFDKSHKVSAFEQNELYNGKKLKWNKNTGTRFPKSVLKFNRVYGKKGHSSQKPLDLMKWLVKTYSHENQIVLDPFCGSATTLVAARDCGRQAIGIEIEQKFIDAAIYRLEHKEGT